jgi:hypothetical protein
MRVPPPVSRTLLSRRRSHPIAYPSSRRRCARSRRQTWRTCAPTPTRLRSVVRKTSTTRAANGIAAHAELVTRQNAATAARVMRLSACAPALPPRGRRSAAAGNAGTFPVSAICHGST